MTPSILAQRRRAVTRLIWRQGGREVQSYTNPVSLQRAINDLTDDGYRPVPGHTSRFTHPATPGTTVTLQKESQH